MEIKYSLKKNGAFKASEKQPRHYILENVRTRRAKYIHEKYLILSGKSFHSLIHNYFFCNNKAH